MMIKIICVDSNSLVDRIFNSAINLKTVFTNPEHRRYVLGICSAAGFLTKSQNDRELCRKVLDRIIFPIDILYEKVRRKKDSPEKRKMMGAINDIAQIISQYQRENML